MVISAIFLINLIRILKLLIESIIRLVVLVDHSDFSVYSSCMPKADISKVLLVSMSFFLLSTAKG